MTVDNDAEPDAPHGRSVHNKHRTQHRTAYTLKISASKEAGVWGAMTLNYLFAPKNIQQTVLTAITSTTSSVCSTAGGGVVWWLAALASINVVNRHWARLVPGWVTVCGRVNISVCNKSPRSTQPSIRPG